MKTIVRSVAMIGVMMWGAVSVRAANYYVAHNGQTESSPYASWATAASNIQDAVNKTVDNDTVWVGPGTYTVPPSPTNYEQSLNVVYITKCITLSSSNGVPESTIIDGGGANRGIAFHYNGTPTKPFVVNGFTISNCWATNYGGGILIHHYLASMLTSVVQNCTITDNKVAWKTVSSGGGIHARHEWDSNWFRLVMSNCVVRRNEALYGPVQLNSGMGGGIGQNIGTMALSDCTVEDCTATVGGGLYGRSAALANCTFRRNRAKLSPLYLYDASCGAMALGGASTLRNCLLANNTTDLKMEHCNFSGAATYTMENCTVVGGSGGNTAYGGPVNLPSAAGKLVCVNSIICSNGLGLASSDRMSINNTLSAGGGHVYVTNSFLEPFPGRGQTLSNYDITNTITGTNISPGFVDYSGKNFRLQRSSPCLNTGLNQAWMTGTRDLVGAPRIDQETQLVDMGCYEYVYPGGTLIQLR